MSRILLLVAVVSISGPVAQAQTAPPNQWAHGTELSVFVGGATTGPMVAGSVGWEVTRWIAIEGRGSWFDRGDDARGFGADLGALVNLVAKRPVTPFLGVGFGLYRASFGGASPAMTDFYRTRMRSRRFAGSHVFTDPALRLTAGVDIIARRHWALRPDVSLVDVRADGHGETLWAAGISVGYRFEDHPITPLRSGQPATRPRCRNVAPDMPGAHPAR
jgi:hypothetical protein